MPRRTILTARQRKTLFGLPSDQPTFLRHYVLSDDDLIHIARRRRDQNRLGFALQLCALRYPGRLLQPGELIPEPMLAFIGAQLGITEDALLTYAARSETRYEHSARLQKLYGYRPFAGMARQDFEAWLVEAAHNARTNDSLAEMAMAELRKRQIIVPAATTLERTCANALVAAERQIVRQISSRIDPGIRIRIKLLLSDTVNGTLTRFVWLRQAEPGHNARAANELLDRLDWIGELDVSSDILDGIPPHRITRLRKQGERYFADGLRDVPEDRRLAILAVCAVEWRATLSDAIIETHNRITGRLYRAAERAASEQIKDESKAVAEALKAFTHIGSEMIAAKEAGAALETVIDQSGGWAGFEKLITRATGLTEKISTDPLDFLGSGYARFRRYTQRMLAAVDIQGGPAAEPLLKAIKVLRDLNRHKDTALPADAPISFARPKWRKRLQPSANPNRRTWEIAVLFALRDAFRSGDVWLAHSRHYRDINRDLIPVSAVQNIRRLAVPFDAASWIENRRTELDAALQAAGAAGVSEASFKSERSDGAVPANADDLILSLYGDMTPTPITDILLQADADIGFTDAFTDLRTGNPCRDQIGLLTVLLADGINLGLKKMASASQGHSFWELMRIARWHVQEDAHARALAMVIEAQAVLPMAQFWGSGISSSSDGQFFPAGGTGEALNLVNAKYGNEPGLKAYTHVSDQFAPFATQTIPATVHEAPYILDGLLMNDAGQNIREHYADTGGFTDHVFALSAILGYIFAPRIRDLASKRLYLFDPSTASPAIRPMIGGKIKTELIERNWPDILRLAASAAVGAIAPSQILRKLASHPRQNELAMTLREVGRIERTIFMLRWITDIDIQRRAQLGLNKGEAHHALKRAISFNRRGEIRDRTAETQSYRIAGMNLLAAIIIYWNTKKLGEIVAKHIEAGAPPNPALLQHVSPLGWEKIILTGKYTWPLA